MIVADASVLLDFVLRSADEPAINRLIVDNAVIAVPEIWSAEILNGLRRHMLRGQLDTKRALIAFETLGQLNTQSHAVLPMAKSLWRLRNNVTIYDASYIVLAEVLDAPFYTRDSRLASTPGHSAKILLI